MAREGFHKTTMAAVIAESGMSAGAVYGYFTSKNDIIRAIADSVLGRMTEQLERLARDATPVPPIGALEAMLEHIRELDQDGDVPRVAVQVWAEAGRDEAIAAIVRERMQRVRSVWSDLLTRARAEGLLSPDADPEAVARVMLGAMVGFLQQHLLFGDVEPRSYADAFRALTAAP